MTRSIVSNYKPVERIVRVLPIGPMSDDDAADFFRKAFDEGGMALADRVLKLLVAYSGGLPKLMHVLGEHAFYAASGELLGLHRVPSLAPRSRQRRRRPLH